MVERFDLYWPALHSTQISVGEGVEVPFSIYSGVAQTHFVLSYIAAVPAEIARYGPIPSSKKLSLM